MQSVVSPSDRRVLLASRSPRRRALLEQVGITPIVRVSDVEEVPRSGESPFDYTLRLSQDKARAVAADVEGDDDLPRFILAADTIVTFDDVLLEKPADAEDARHMLRALSGRHHEVHTAYCWLDRAGGSVTDCVTTRVRFRELSDETIARYVATGEPMDKAGAYGIQGIGGVLVEGVEGSYSCVVGLPISHVLASLTYLGGIEGFPFPPADEVTP